MNTSLNMCPWVSLTVYVMTVRHELRAHTLVFVFQVSVRTEVLHEVFVILQVVIPILNVFLIPLRKHKALQTHMHTNKCHCWLSMCVCLSSANKIKQNQVRLGNKWPQVKQSYGCGMTCIMLDSVIHDKFNAQNIEQQTKLNVLLHFTVFLSLSQVTQISCEMVSLETK